MGLPVSICSTPRRAMISVPEAWQLPRTPGSSARRISSSRKLSESCLPGRGNSPIRSAPARRPFPSGPKACPCRWRPPSRSPRRHRQGSGRVTPAAVAPVLARWAWKSPSRAMLGSSSGRPSLPMLGDMAQRVGAGVAELPGVGGGADAEGIEHDHQGSWHVSFLRESVCRIPVAVVPGRAHRCSRPPDRQGSALASSALRAWIRASGRSAGLTRSPSWTSRSGRPPDRSGRRPAGARRRGRPRPAERAHVDRFTNPSPSAWTSSTQAPARWRSGCSTRSLGPAQGLDHGGEALGRAAAFEGLVHAALAHRRGRSARRPATSISTASSRLSVISESRRGSTAQTVDDSAISSALPALSASGWLMSVSSAWVRYAGARTHFAQPARRDGGRGRGRS